MNVAQARDRAHTTFISIILTRVIFFFRVHFSLIKYRIYSSVKNVHNSIKFTAKHVYTQTHRNALWLTMVGAHDSGEHTNIKTRALAYIRTHAEEILTRMRADMHLLSVSYYRCIRIIYIHSKTHLRVHSVTYTRTDTQIIYIYTHKNAKMQDPTHIQICSNSRTYISP